MVIKSFYKGLMALVLGLGMSNSAFSFGWEDFKDMCNEYKGYMAAGGLAIAGTGASIFYVKKYSKELGDLGANLLINSALLVGGAALVHMLIKIYPDLTPRQKAAFCFLVSLGALGGAKYYWTLASGFTSRHAKIANQVLPAVVSAH